MQDRKEGGKKGGGIFFEHYGLYCTVLYDIRRLCVLLLFVSLNATEYRTAADLLH